MAPENIGSSQTLSDSSQDAWEFPIVLSLDGGGIRGLSSLLILKAIFMKVACLDPGNEHHDEIGHGTLTARPCYYFDHMVGTSTGGLIAVMLGRMRMFIQEAIEVYLRYGDEVFGNPKPLGLLPRYSSDAFERVLKGVCQTHCSEGPQSGQDALMRQNDYNDEIEKRCMTVVSFKPNPEGHFDNIWLFRSYDHIHSRDEGLGVLRNPGFAEFVNAGVKFWQVYRATTAAPTYFEEMKIEQSRYLDGGLGANNPAHLAYNNAKQVPRNENHELGMFVSIGTGIRKARSLFGRIPLLGNVLGVLGLARYNLTDTEDIHTMMKDLFSASKTFYARFNVDLDLHDMPLDEWKRYRSSKKADEERSRHHDLGAGPQTADAPMIPHLLNTDADADMQAILREVKTVNRIQHATRKYLRRDKTYPGSPPFFAVQPSIHKCALGLAEQAQARRRANPGRWQCFVGEPDSEPISPINSTLRNKTTTFSTINTTEDPG